jgi:2-oxoglutarate dehydrogenase E2 component (dihydrolipoamide succinyltransferase)
MPSEIIMPNVGADTIALSAWFAEPGETVFEGDRLVEVVMDGATFDVPSPITGRLVEKRAFTNDQVQAGQVLGIVEPEMAPRKN